MRIIHRICHFFLYTILFVSKLIHTKWQQLKEYIVDTAQHLVYRTDQRVIANSNLAENLVNSKKQLQHVALIFNQIRHDIELDEISRITTIIQYLIQLQTQTITIFDQQGRLSRHSQLIMEVLRIALMRKDQDTILSGTGNVIKIKGGAEIRFESEEVIPKAETLKGSLPQLAFVFNSPR